MRDDTSNRKLGLDDAYAVETPDDNRALYRDWASSYEAEFIDTHRYVYHRNVAELYAASQADVEAPVLDVGCGTGIVGVALRDAGVTTVDGIDISPEMLEEAAHKQAYRDLTVVDVTEPLPMADDLYGGVVSAGTFTHGHLGPEPLPELVRIVRPGGVLAIGINAEHFEEHGFSAALDDLAARGAIAPPELESIRMYEAGAGDWADDLALVAVLRKR